MSSAEKRLRAALAVNVRRLREERGLSVEEVAHRSKLHPRHWQKIEAGEVNVTIGTLAKLQDVLGTSVVDLLR